MIRDDPKIDITESVEFSVGDMKKRIITDYGSSTPAQPTTHPLARTGTPSQPSKNVKTYSAPDPTTESEPVVNHPDGLPPDAPAPSVSPALTAAQQWLAEMHAVLLARHAQHRNDAAYWDSRRPDDLDLDAVMQAVADRFADDRQHRQAQAAAD